MENLNNQHENQTKARPPAIPIVAPIKRSFESYGEKSAYFLDIDKQIELRREQIKIAKSLSATNPTASQKAYDEIIAANEKEITELEQQKKDMLSGETRH